MQRITINMLESKLAYLNRITENPPTQYTLDAEGKYTANIGNYHLSQCYGGVCVHQIMNEGGGVTVPLTDGYRPKREVFTELSAFIRGIEAGKQ